MSDAHQPLKDDVEVDELADVLRRSEVLGEQSLHLQRECEALAKRVRELLQRRLVHSTDGPRERRTP